MRLSRYEWIVLALMAATLMAAGPPTLWAEGPARVFAIAAYLLLWALFAAVWLMRRDYYLKQVRIALQLADCHDSRK